MANFLSAKKEKEGGAGRGKGPRVAKKQKRFLRGGEGRRSSLASRAKRIRRRKLERGEKKLDGLFKKQVTRKRKSSRNDPLKQAKCLIKHLSDS